ERAARVNARAGESRAASNVGGGRYHCPSMAEAALHLPDPHAAHLAALASAAALLEWPLPRERDEATCHELTRLVDALLVRVARGRGALDVAVGEALDLLGSGARVSILGHSGIGDYARERLGIAASTAQKMVRFARRLRERQLLRAAVRAGEVPVRAAEAVMPAARGENEAAGVERERRRHSPGRAARGARFHQGMVGEGVGAVGVSRLAGARRGARPGPRRRARSPPPRRGTAPPRRSA